MAGNQKNQGEGNKEADRSYREKAEAFAQQKDVKKQANQAKQALNDEEEGKLLREAEQKGKARAKGQA